MKQSVPRWLTTDDAIIALTLALVDKICPACCCCIAKAARSGSRCRAAPDKVRPRRDRSATAGNVGKAAALKNTPTLMLFGDYVDQHPRWSTFKKIDLEYAAAVRAGGGRRRRDHLPDIGIKVTPIC